MTGQEIVTDSRDRSITVYQDGKPVFDWPADGMEGLLTALSLGRRYGDTDVVSSGK